MLLEVGDIPLQAKRLEFPMCRDQQCAARGFIAAARLNSHKTILHQIHTPHRIAGSDFIQQLDQRHGIHFHPVHRHRNSFCEADLHFLFFIGRFFRRASDLPCRCQGRIGSVF